MKKSSAPRRPKRALGLVFCEDENDAIALSNISASIRPDLPKLKYCRKPLILVRDQKDAEGRKRNANQVVRVVRAIEQIADVRFIVAHQDCDDFEPAHEQLAETIRAELVNAGLSNVVAVAPAWETEAWWFLWPTAVALVNSKWRKLTRTGNHGLIKDAKEAITRDLRSPNARDYVESDSRAISAKVLENDLIDNKIGQSASFEQFRTELLGLQI